MIRPLLYVINSPVIVKLFQRLVPFRLPLAVVINLVLMAAAYLGAYYLRFEGLIPLEQYHTMLRDLPIFIVVQGFFFHYDNLFQGLWRYVSFSDLQNILRASLRSMLLIFCLEYIFPSYIGTIPRSIYLLNCLLLVVLTGGCRFMVRLYRENNVALAESCYTRRVILVGPVDTVEPLIREIYSHGSEYFPVAIVDPLGSWRRGFRLYDFPLVGGLRHLMETIKKYRAQEIIFAWPNAPQDQLNETIEECKRLQVRFKILPSFGEVLEGRFRMVDVRDIELEDLLPRPPIYIDRDNIRNFIQDQVIMVTGGGGSIGSELCRQIARFSPRRLILLERAENNLYDIEIELLRRFPHLNLDFQIASVNDAPGLNILLNQYQPQVIFHAAAYKHVPLMERCPIEAAYNNILGTQNLVKAALKAKVECFVMISTDKAVNPTSVMGVSKRIAEKYVQACNHNNSTRFITTRFGNVLGSSGSVIPLFKKQLSQGGPLTVTHQDIERFFMTIPEAVQLVLQAAQMGHGGDIFVLSMGRAVKIVELAEKIITLAGKTPGKEIDIIYTGLRPGEKLYEELFNDDEQQQPTDHPLLKRALCPIESLKIWEKHLSEIQELVRKRDHDGLVKKIKTVIPNYTPFAETWLEGETRESVSNATA